MFQFEITAKDQKARTGVFTTPYRKLETPTLAIVATQGELKSIKNNFWSQLPNTYLIVNTFHIYTNRKMIDGTEQNILEAVTKKGGIHQFMAIQDKTIASDSGGFQVFSLGFGKAHNIGKVGGFFPTVDPSEIPDKDTGNPLVITDDGVSFQFDGKEIYLNPEISMDIQHKIGADIMFAFDECTSPLNSYEYTKESLVRTHTWIDRCVEAHKGFEEKQALFGIVQGGPYEDLRIESAKVIGSKDVPGFGIGGSMGKTRDELYTIVGWIMPHLPENKPKHLLGIGTVQHIFDGVEQGVDLFDCVIPTREARHRMIYTKKGRLYLRKLKHLNEVIDISCGCQTCREGITTEQLWKYFLEHDPKATFYTTIHNIWFFMNLMEEIRNAIASKTFMRLKEEYRRHYP